MFKIIKFSLQKLELKKIGLILFWHCCIKKEHGLDNEIGIFQLEILFRGRPRFFINHFFEVFIQRDIEKLQL